MHELPITQEIIRIACEEATKVHAKAIKEINLVVGDMSGMIDDSIRFYFDTLAKGTLAQGSVINILRKSVIVRCSSCEYTFSPSGDMLNWECPQCHQWAVQILQGQEFLVDSIEVEDEG